MNSTVAIVVTYNRKKLLEENINALLNQKYKCDILVIDNASTDGTDKMVSELNDGRIIYVNTGKNLGGAGGFSFGVKKAIEKGYEFGWIMDDDSIANENALESLQQKAKMVDYNFSFFASLVYWIDKKIFPMNYADFISYNKNNSINTADLISKYKIAEIDSCSFVGCFVNLKIAKQIALPIADFFIYGDDIEYTRRLSRKEKAYIDFDSIIVHKAPSNIGCDIRYASVNRIDRFFYQSRNGMYRAKRDGCIFKRLKIFIKQIIGIMFKSKDNKVKRIKVLIKGTLAGLRFNPKLEYVDDETIKGE